MERDLSAVVDLVTEAFPDLEWTSNLDEWMAGKFEPPIAFIQVQGVAEKGHTLTANRVICDAGIVLHHPKVNGEYQPISTEPLRAILRRERFGYRGKTDGLYIEIDSDSLDISSERKDRTEITFRFEYKVSIPRPVVEKINTFEIEEGWE